MIKCIVVDDEPNAIENIVIDLKEHQNIHILKTFSNPTKALLFLDNNSIDLLFLDIEMPVLDGFQLLQKTTNKNFDVIITTAYNEYAIKAFKHNAIDYLLKPIDNTELKLAITKANTRLLEKKKNKNDILLALSKIRYPQKIALKTSGKLLFFEPKEISHVVSDGNYSKIHLSDGNLLFITKKLKEIEEILPTLIFLRVHNSFIINLQKIKSFVISESFIILEKEVKIPVSRSYKEDLLGKI